jgi:ADP-ribosylglycohydrolase
VVESAEFFARVACQVLRKTPPSEALTMVLQQHFNREPFETWTYKGIESAAMDTRQAISTFGQMCGVSAAFPAVIHLIVKYSDNLKEALVENVMAGGDSAARGLLTGMIIGAYMGMDAIPHDWLDDLKSRETIVQLLAGLDPAGA